jgi:SAM-dependent methyltransferase
MSTPSYLEPYLRASERHKGGFGSLLWASPKTQAARFAALTRCCDFSNRSILDAGCGRADFLDYLDRVGISPARYIGLEAMESTAAFARQKRQPNARIVLGDFVRDPWVLDQRTDIIVFCGSLNTLSGDEFYATLRMAWRFAGLALVFNFLNSQKLAQSSHLYWRETHDVLQFTGRLTHQIVVDDEYIEGDCTMVLRKAL